jgi:hypothetical protein
VALSRSALRAQSTRSAKHHQQHRGEHARRRQQRQAGGRHHNQHAKDQPVPAAGGVGPVGPQRRAEQGQQQGSARSTAELRAAQPLAIKDPRNGKKQAPAANSRTFAANGPTDFDIGSSD